MSKETWDKGGICERIAENVAFPLVVIRQGDVYRICCQDDRRKVMVDLTMELHAMFSDLTRAANPLRKVPSNEQ